MAVGFRAHPGLWDGWEVLAVDAPMVGSAPWLRMRAPRMDGETWTFTVDGATGAIAGIFATVAAEGVADDAFDLRHLVAGSARTALDGETADVSSLRAAVGAVANWYPHLAVAYPGYECFVAGSARDDPVVVAELVAGIVDWVEARDMAAVGFLYTLPEDAVLADALTGAGFTSAPFTAANDLHLVGDGFDDYLAGLPRHHRAEIRRERRRLSSKGITSGPVDLDSERQALVALRLQHAARYGRKVSGEKEHGRIAAVVDAFGAANVVAFGTRAPDGTVLSFSVVVDWKGEWYVLDTGTDYGHPDHRLGYFEACYYAPIEAAYRRGVQVLHFGLGSWDAKRYRGCVAAPRHVWARLPAPAATT